MSDTRDKQPKQAMTDGEDLSTLFSDISKSLSSVDKSLTSLATALKVNVKDEEKVDKDSIKNYRDVLKVAQDNWNKSGDKMLTTGQKVGAGLINTFKVVADRAISLFTNEFSKVQNSFLSSFSDITTRMQWSEKQYRDSVNASSSRFRREGLDGQFNSTDFINELKNTLAYGLRGSLAEEKTYQDLIAKKLVPSLNTATKSYNVMYKKMGDLYTKNTVGLAKLTEAVIGNSELYEQGLYDTTVGDFIKDVLSEARVKGVSDSKVLELQNSMVYYASSLQKAGVDADQVFSELKESFNKGYGDQTLLMDMMGAFSGEQFIQDAFRDPNAFFNKLTKAYVNIGSVRDRGLASTYSGIFGTDLNNVRAIAAYSDEINTDFNKLINSVDSNTKYQEEYAKLQKGQYTDATTKLDNTISNMTTSIATWTAQIPHFSELFSDIRNIVGTIALLVATKSVAGDKGLSGVGSKIKGLAGKPIGTGSATYGGVAVGAGGFLVGAIGTGYGAYKSGSLSASNGNGFGTNALAALVGSATGGGTTIGMTEAQKLENHEIDWGSVGTSLVAGAGVGAGIGTATAGWAAGMGTVIGAGIGAISASVTSLVDQLIEKYQYDEYADAMEAATESADNLSVANEEFRQSMVNATSIEEKLNILKKGSTSGEKVQLDTLNELKSLYPQYLTNVKDVNDVTEDQLNVIKSVVEAEKMKSASSAYSSANTAYSSTSDILGGLDLTEGEFVSKESYNKYKKEQTALDSQIGTMSSEQYAAKSNELAKLYGVTKGTANYIYDESLGLYKYKNADDSHSSLLASQLTEAYANLTGMYGNLVSYYDPESELSPGFRSMYEDTASKFSELVKSYNNQARSTGLAVPFTKESFSNPSIDDLNSWSGYSIAFKTGKYNISSDGTRAVLHRGEMVLPKSEADMYRQLLSSAGMSSAAYLEALSSSSGTTAVGMSSKSSVVVSSIQSTVENIYAVLVNILEVIPSTRTTNNTYEYKNPNLVEYTGGAL